MLWTGDGLFQTSVVYGLGMFYMFQTSLGNILDMCSSHVGHDLDMRWTCFGDVWNGLPQLIHTERVQGANLSWYRLRENREMQGPIPSKSLFFFAMKLWVHLGREGLAQR